ncbi:MAG TPA: DUF4350 domain-containing protein [Vicinamibacterales bacterium]|nr:DUF4350 domain-containing protein [Vicinamibacterales bacterium]
MLKRILNLIGWLGAALVLAAVALSLLRPELVTWRKGLAIAGLVCTLLYMLSQWREIGRSLARRQVRYSAVSAGSVVVVLLILAGINYIANRQSKRWDLTAGGQYTLSDQTKKILGSLKQPMKVRVFATSQAEGPLRDRLTEYAGETRNLSIEYIDPLKHPELAGQYQVQQDGTVVFDYNGRVERATSPSEQDLTNAIVKAVQGEQKKVYFVQGHGEKDTGSSERSGYSGVSDALRGDNFTIERIVLAQQTSVPADAAVVVVAGPRTDYLPAEIDMLRAYLRKGGKVLLMLDPPERNDSPAQPNLVALAREWGVEVGSNVVVDLSPAGRLLGTGPSVPVAASYPSHPINDRMEVLTAYPLARSIAPVSGGVNGHVAQAIVETSANSWAETDLKGLLTSGEARREENTGDKPGPVALAAAVSAQAPEAPAPAEGQSKPETRVVVFGDSDFASNVALGVQGNRDFFLNTVNWLAQHEDMIAIRSKEPSDRRLTMTAGEQRALVLLSLLVIPGLIIIAGVHAWWRRR